MTTIPKGAAIRRLIQKLEGPALTSTSHGLEIQFIITERLQLEGKDPETEGMAMIKIGNSEKDYPFTLTQREPGFTIDTKDVQDIGDHACNCKYGLKIQLTEYPGETYDAYLHSYGFRDTQGCIYLGLIAKEWAKPYNSIRNRLSTSLIWRTINGIDVSHLTRTLTTHTQGLAV